MRIRSLLVSVLILACSVARSPASAQGVQDSDDEQIRSDLEEAQAEAAVLGEDLLRAGAPWVEGNPLPRRPGG